MAVYIKLRIVNYWSKLINGKDSKRSLILYQYMYINKCHGQYPESCYKLCKVNFESGPD